MPHRWPPGRELAIGRQAHRDGHVRRLQLAGALALRRRARRFRRGRSARWRSVELWLSHPDAVRRPVQALL
eukprot:6170818-Heterocapsa_arctica.AAC.1